MLLDVAYVGNKADDLLLVANYNQAVAEQCRRHDSAGGAPADSDASATSPTSSTAASRATTRFQMKYEWRMGADVTLLSSLTLSKAKDNGAGALENQNGNFPAPQDINNLDADYGLSALPPAVQQHDQLRRGRCRSAAASAGAAACRRRSMCSSAAGSWPASTRHAGRDGDVHLHAGRGVPGVGHHERLLRREQLPAEHHLRSVRGGGPERSRTGSTRRASSLPTDPSQPFGNAPRNNVRGPNFWQFDLAASKNVALGGQAPSCSSGSRRSTCSTGPTSRRRPRTAATDVRHHHGHLRPAPGAARRESALVGLSSSAPAAWPLARSLQGRGPWHFGSGPTNRLRMSCAGWREKSCGRPAKSSAGRIRRTTRPFTKRARASRRCAPSAT